jgi:hypothetical protein
MGNTSFTLLFLPYLLADIQLLHFAPKCDTGYLQAVGRCSDFSVTFSQSPFDAFDLTGLYRITD